MSPPAASPAWARPACEPSSGSTRSRSRRPRSRTSVRRAEVEVSESRHRSATLAVRRRASAGPSSNLNRTARVCRARHRNRTPNRSPPVSQTDELLANNEQYAASFDKADLPIPPGQQGGGGGLHGRAPARVRRARAPGGRRSRDPQRRRRGHRRRDPLAGDLPAAARHRGDHPHPPHRLRHAHVHRRRLQGVDRAATPAIKPGWAAEAFTDLDGDVRQSIARVKASPFIPRKDSVRGFVYEVETGRLREVS